MIRLRTAHEPKFYVCEIRGAVFISYVTEANKDNALDFKTVENANKWRNTIEEMSGVTLGIDIEEPNLKQENR